MEENNKNKKVVIISVIVVIVLIIIIAVYYSFMYHNKNTVNIPNNKSTLSSSTLKYRQRTDKLNRLYRQANQNGTSTKPIIKELNAQYKSYINQKTSTQEDIKKQIDELNKLYANSTSTNTNVTVPTNIK